MLFFTNNPHPKEQKRNVAGGTVEWANYLQFDMQQKFVCKNCDVKSHFLTSSFVPNLGLLFAL